jgi:hypothetical protein
MDDGDPKSGRQNDEPASEPPRNLLIVLSRKNRQNEFMTVVLH